MPGCGGRICIQRREGQEAAKFRRQDTARQTKRSHAQCHRGHAQQARQFKRLQTIPQAPGGPRDFHHIGIHRHRCRPAGQILRTAIEVMFAQHQPRAVRTNLLRMVHHQPHLLPDVGAARPCGLLKIQKLRGHLGRAHRFEKRNPIGFFPAPRSPFGIGSTRQQHRKRTFLNQSTSCGHTLGMFDQHIDAKFHQVRATRLGLLGLLERRRNIAGIFNFNGNRHQCHVPRSYDEFQCQKTAKNSIWNSPGPLA